MTQENHRKRIGKRKYENKNSSDNFRIHQPRFDRVIDYKQGQDRQTKDTDMITR